ncbi:MOSC domain-containing protein [Roseivirga sp.]|uniref:MOSC domain-containing protein n=1 Tax=Roseivirga sp. TaxID=1964215 RepID=UPI003B52C23B
MVSIRQIFIYPIKSLGGIELKTSRVERKGLAFDRRWMLVDDNGRFISQREFPKLALLKPSIVEDALYIEDTVGTLDRLEITLHEPDTDPIQVSVWDDQMKAKPMADEINHWFSTYLEQPVRLVFMHATSERIADQRYAPKPDDMVSFADGYPVLIINQASMDLLSKKVGQEIPVNRFRPNLVIDGVKAHEEDTLAEISINGLRFFGVKPCARCVMTTIDQQTAEKGKEPLKTLASYRSVEHKILFGENFIPDQSGEINQGDQVQILKVKPAPIQLV